MEESKRQFHESWYSTSSPPKESYVTPPNIDKRRTLMFKTLTEDVTSNLIQFTDLITAISLLVCLGMLEYAEHLLEEGLSRTSKGSYLEELCVNTSILSDQVASLAEMGEKYARLVRWITRIIGDMYTYAVAQKTVGLVTSDEFHLLFPTVT